MPFVPVPDCVEAELVFQGPESQVCENTLYFEKVDPSVGDMLALGEALVDAWDTQIKPYVSDEVTLIKVVLTDLSSESAPRVEYAIGLPISGTDTANVLPLGCSFAIKFVTAGRGRSARGRNYVIGLTDHRLTPDALTAAYAEDLRSAWHLMCTAAAGEDWVHVVVSRISGGAPRLEGVKFGVSSYAITDTAIDSQRRRLIGRGR